MARQDVELPATPDSNSFPVSPLEAAFEELLDMVDSVLVAAGAEVDPSPPDPAGTDPCGLGTSSGLGFPFPFPFAFTFAFPLPLPLPLPFFSLSGLILSAPEIVLREAEFAFSIVADVAVTKEVSELFMGEPKESAELAPSPFSSVLPEASFISLGVDFEPVDSGLVTSEPAASDPVIIDAITLDPVASEPGAVVAETDSAVTEVFTAAESPAGHEEQTDVSVSVVTSGLWVSVATPGVMTAVEKPPRQFSQAYVSVLEETMLKTDMVWVDSSVTVE